MSDNAAIAALQAEDGTVKKEYKEFKIADIPQIAQALTSILGIMKGAGNSNSNGGS